MKAKMINQEHVEGYLYEHNLAIKKVQNETSANYGKEYINGDINIATDELGMNVIPIHFTYVTEMTAKGNKNQTFVALKNIIENGKTWIKDGKDNAMMLKVDTKLGLNDFYNQSNELVSAKQNDGGFVTIVNKLADVSERNTFAVDMVITGTNMVETEEGNPYMQLKGAVFDYKNSILPVDFTVRNSAGISYFENEDITNSNPMFTKVWGRITSTTSTTETTEESAFGEASVKKYEKKTKEWTVTGAAKVPYDFGDPAVLDADQLTKAIQERNLYLASIKKQAEDYRAERDTKAATPSGFSFNAMPNPTTFEF